MKVDDEAKSFLKREARIAFKALEFKERQRIGSYKPIYKDMLEAWRSGATIEFPPGWKEQHKKMEAGEEIEDNLGLHKLYGEVPDMKPGQVVTSKSLIKRWVDKILGKG